MAAFATAALIGAAVAHADPGTPMMECPNTHAHVWHKDQCDDISNPFGVPGTGHGGNSSGGLLGLLGHLL
jgi:hypothetical protein